MNVYPSVICFLQIRLSPFYSFYFTDSRLFFNHNQQFYKKCRNLSLDFVRFCQAAFDMFFHLS